MRTALLALLLLGITWSSAVAEDKTLEPLMTFSGSVEDAELLGKFSTAISTPQEFEELWKAWKLAGETPKVDFEKALVVVQTTSGSRLRVTVRLTDEGDLKVLGLATRDLRPGFRYVIVSVARDGVKTVEGKPLAAAEAAPPESKEEAK